MKAKQLKETTIKDYYRSIGIVTPKKLLDRETQLFDAKNKDIELLLSANDALVNQYQQQKSKNLWDYRYIIIVSSTAMALVITFFTQIHIWSKDSETKALKAEIERLQQSNLAVENAALKKRLEDQKCLFSFCLK